MRTDLGVQQDKNKSLSRFPRKGPSVDQCCYGYFSTVSSGAGTQRGQIKVRLIDILGAIYRHNVNTADTKDPPDTIPVPRHVCVDSIDEGRTSGLIYQTVL